ncbi:MAG: tetratricopeptide repeat protein [Desulfatiglandales bacterium]
MMKIIDWFVTWKTNRMIGRCVFLLSIGKYDRAMKQILKVIERDSENPMAWTAKGLTLAKLGKHKKAVEAYERALRLNPPDKEREQVTGFLKLAKEKIQ